MIGRLLRGKSRPARLLSSTTDVRKGVFGKGPDENFHQFGSVTFEDFLQADTNRDGRVSSAEWESYVRSKAKSDQDPYLRGTNIHLPLSPSVLRDILESDGFGLTINGLHYSVHLQAEGDTAQLIESREAQLHRVCKKIEELEAAKAPLDAAAARHTRRVMSGILAYLVCQAATVAKLTFFSRFGWDVMEYV